MSVYHSCCDSCVASHAHLPCKSQVPWAAPFALPLNPPRWGFAASADKVILFLKIERSFISLPENVSTKISSEALVIYSCMAFMLSSTSRMCLSVRTSMKPFAFAQSHVPSSCEPTASLGKRGRGGASQLLVNHWCLNRSRATTSYGFKTSPSTPK